MFALDEPAFSAAGGTGSFQIFCADGIFVQLGATNLGTNTLRIEYATNLFLPVWKPFPSPRFQLVFATNSPPFLFPLDQSNNFFSEGSHETGIDAAP